MNGTRAAGLVLALVGLVVLLYSTVGFTRREEIEFGPVEVEYRTTDRGPFTPVVGGVVLAAGLVLLFGSRKRGGRRVAD